MKKLFFFSIGVILFTLGCSDNSTQTQESEIRKLIMLSKSRKYFEVIRSTLTRVEKTDNGVQFLFPVNPAYTASTGDSLVQAHFEPTGTYSIKSSMLDSASDYLHLPISSGKWELIDNDTKIRMSGFNENKPCQVIRVYYNAFEIKVAINGQDVVIAFFQPIYT